MFYLLGQALILPHQPLNNTTQLHEPIPRQAIFFKQEIPECFLKCVFFLTVFSLRRFFAAMKLEIIWHFSFSFTSILMQYYKQTEAYKVTLHYMNTTLTGLFTLECVMKIFSFGFRVCRYGAIQLRRRQIFTIFLPLPPSVGRILLKVS